MGALDLILSKAGGETRRFRVATLLLAASVLSLASAYYFQFVLNLPPCQLCLIQRWPFYAAIPAAALAAWTSGRAPVVSRILLALIGLGFLAGAGVAAFHAGVEWKFWPGLAGCSNPFSTVDNADAFLQRLQQVQVVSCEEAAWRFAGISLAGWNVPLSLILAILAFTGVVGKGKNARS